MNGQRLRGLLSTIVLMAVTAGVPWFLYHLGGGLPTTTPSVHKVGSFLGQPITDTAILRGVSLLCWVVWLLFIAAVATEAAAWVRARPGPATTHRGFRIPGLQGAAGTLFLTAILLLPQRPALGSQSPMTAPYGAAHARPVLTSFRPADEGHADLQLATASADSRQADRIPYTVKRYDTPWGIAEEYLGNGLRWREITDADGNTLATGVDDWAQINGRLIDEPQARLIFPGQILYLPVTGGSVPHPARPGVETSSAEKPQQAPPVAPSHHLDDGADPEMPADPRSDPPPTSISAEPIPSSTGIASLHHQEVSAPRRDDQVEIAGLLAAGMVVGATLTTITRLRLNQSRARMPGRRIRIPTGELASKEMALRVASREDLIHAAHRALHGLVADLQAESLPAPTILAVLAGEEWVEILLDRPVPPPQTWSVSADGFRWSLGRDAIPDLTTSARDPVPALVPLGRLPGTTTEVLINLEAAGIISVRGDDERAAGLIVSAALALAGLPWAGSADVILVGFSETLAQAGPHIRTVPTLEAVVDELEAMGAPEGLGGAPRGHLTLDANRPDGWLPTIVLSAGGADDRALSRLSSLCADRAGISAMFVAGPYGEYGCLLNVDSAPAYIPQLRLALEVTSLPAEELTALTEILETALDTEGVTVDDPPYSALESSTRPPIAVPRATQPGPSEATLPPARINVLGVVEYINVDDFRRPRSQETTIYLAMHPQGVSEAQLDEKIWPTRTVPASTRDPVISAVRSALGGVERFPHATAQGQQKIYRLSNQVATDWSQFCALYRAGRQNDSVDSLQAALDLVRGRPFGDLDGGPGYQWLHTEGHVRHMQAEIADCADLAAGMYLDLGQPVEARWAATRGLVADCYAERLWVRLMAAADALGEPQEVERILAEMDLRMGLEGDFESLHPDTIAAYRRYSRNRGYHLT
jgi:DNA-binding SARP family transcriptional activator